MTMAQFAFRSCVRRYHSLVRNGLNFGNGERYAIPATSNGFRALDPASGEVIAEFDNTPSSKIDETVANAGTAFEKWSRLTPIERSNVLRKAADLINNNVERIAQEEVRNNGKPIAEAMFDVAGCVDVFNYYAGLATNLFGEHIPLGGDNFALTSREPLGVVCGIGAWNYPFQTMTWKVAPALACGNSFIYKPSPFTPITAVILAELLTEAGVPPGGISVLQGDGSVGRALCLHPQVAKVSFTGSVPTGQAIMRAAAEKGLRPVTLELGGKSPVLIFEDAHLENAVKGTLMANFLTQGEILETRFYINR